MVSSVVSGVTMSWVERIRESAIVVFVGKYAVVESVAIPSGEEMIVKEFGAERGMMYYELYYKEERWFNCNEMSFQTIT